MISSMVAPPWRQHNTKLWYGGSHPLKRFNLGKKEEQGEFNKLGKKLVNILKKLKTKNKNKLETSWTSSFIRFSIVGHSLGKHSETKNLTVQRCSPSRSMVEFHHAYGFIWYYSPSPFNLRNQQMWSWILSKLTLRSCTKANTVTWVAAEWMAESFSHVMSTISILSFKKADKFCHGVFLGHWSLPEASMYQWKILDSKWRIYNSSFIKLKSAQMLVLQSYHPFKSSYVYGFPVFHLPHVQGSIEGGTLSLEKTHVDQPSAWKPLKTYMKPPEKKVLGIFVEYQLLFFLRLANAKHLPQHLGNASTHESSNFTNSLPPKCHSTILRPFSWKKHVMVHHVRHFFGLLGLLGRHLLGFPRSSAATLPPERCRWPTPTAGGCEARCPQPEDLATDRCRSPPAEPQINGEKSGEEKHWEKF